MALEFFLDQAISCWTHRSELPPKDELITTFKLYVLSKDRDKFEVSGDDRYVDKAHRRSKIGWNVGRRIEVAPHYRRPHMVLVWTGRGRAVPRVVSRRGSVMHRELVEKVPSGFGE